MTKEEEQTKDKEKNKEMQQNEIIKKNTYMTYLLILIFVIAIFNFYGIMNLNNKIDSISKNFNNVLSELKESQKTVVITPQPTTTVTTTIVKRQKQIPEITTVGVDDDPARGSDNAPVIMIEFSDFQCPFCGRFFQQTLPLIEKNYIKTGKVKLVYRDFPLSFHQYAQKAAEAAECANNQGKFWEMHNTIFENQNALDVNSLKKYAEKLGLDATKFNNCLDSGKYKNEIEKDISDGKKAGVSGTPTFFINGVKIVGAQPYSVFKQAIEQQLSK